MRARLLLDRRVVTSPVSFVEMVLWQVPVPVRGNRHPYKYRLAFVVRGRCVLRFDNEAGKGDHLHIGERDKDYVFTDPDQLIVDFPRHVRGWLDEHGDA
jgi:Family of unknown function (DUF6516)